jgi:hypothetical protein
MSVFIQKYIALFLIFLIMSGFQPQHSNPVKIYFHQINPKIIVDGFNQIYLIDKTQIIKHKQDGSVFKTFSIKRYGDITDVDATNPLKIQVFYKDYQQIIFLDNQLTESNAAISLEKLGYEQCELTCTSANNSFWIYNKQDNELIRLNGDLNPFIKTGNLKRILEIDIKPNFMREHNGYLYLNCPKEGILVFDIFGTYYKTIPIKNLTEFSIQNSNIIYFQKGILYEYQTQSFNTNNKNFEDSLLINVIYQNNTFYKIYNDSLVTE